MNLSTIPEGQTVFIEMHDRLWLGTVTLKYDQDRTFQVQTEAAKLVRPKWRHLLFSQHDGQCLVWRDTVTLIVPTSREQIESLLARMKAQEKPAQVSIPATPEPEPEPADRTDWEPRFDKEWE